MSVARIVTGGSSRPKTSMTAMASEYGSSPVDGRGRPQSRAPAPMRRPEGVLGGHVEVPRVAEEPGEARREQPDQPAARLRVALLGPAEQGIEPGDLVDPGAEAPALDELAVARGELDAREKQRQTAGAVELLVGQHREAGWLGSEPPAPS